MFFNRFEFCFPNHIVVTPLARAAMHKNWLNIQNPRYCLSTHELVAMSNVVNGLDAVHKGQEGLKALLSHVTTYVELDAEKEICKAKWEKEHSCYFLLSGSVEATYGFPREGSRKRSFFKPHVVYQHVAGQYIGVLSGDIGDVDDQPALTLYTALPSRLLRIDRTMFHERLHTVLGTLTREVRQLFTLPKFSLLTPADVDHLLTIFDSESVPANTVLLRQGQPSPYLFLVHHGSCSVYRQLLDHNNQSVTVLLELRRDKGDFFGEQHVLAEKSVEPSQYSVRTETRVRVFKFTRANVHRMRHDTRERFLATVRRHRVQLPHNDQLRAAVAMERTWSRAKHAVLNDAVARCLRNRSVSQFCHRPTNHDYAIEHVPSAPVLRHKAGYLKFPDIRDKSLEQNQIVKLVETINEQNRLAHNAADFI